MHIDMGAEELRRTIDCRAASDAFGLGDAIVETRFHSMIRQPAIDRLRWELGGPWKRRNDRA